MNCFKLILSLLIDPFFKLFITTLVIVAIAIAIIIIVIVIALIIAIAAYLLA